MSLFWAHLAFIKSEMKFQKFSNWPKITQSGHPGWMKNRRQNLPFRFPWDQSPGANPIKLFTAVIYGFS
jgi:hypothetical protein